MEVKPVSTHVDVSPVSTVEISPGKRVAVYCDVAAGGGGPHYLPDPGLVCPGS